MGDIWELHPSVSGEIIREPLAEQFWHNNLYLKISSISFDVFVASRGSTVFVTEDGKEFFEKNSDGWVIAEECPVNDKGLYVVHEWDMQKLLHMKKTTI